MNKPRPKPPRLANWLLRVCCSPAHLEEIEGDLHEMFTRRAGRQGVARARQRYVLDVGGVCLLQVSARMIGALTRTGRVRRVLGVVGLLLAMVVVLLTNEQRWAIVTGYAVLCALGILELLVYAGNAFAILKALARPARERKQDTSDDDARSHHRR